MSDCVKGFVSEFIRDLNNPKSTVYNNIEESIKEGYNGRVGLYQDYNNKYACTRKLSYEDQWYVNKELKSHIPEPFKFESDSDGYIIQWRH